MWSSEASESPEARDDSLFLCSCRRRGRHIPGYRGLGIGSACDDLSHASTSPPSPAFHPTCIHLIASTPRRISSEKPLLDSLRFFATCYLYVHADEDAEPSGRGARKEELARPTLASPAVPAATSPGTRPSVSLIGGICPYQTPLSTSTPARILLTPLRGNCRLMLPSSAPSCCVRSLHLPICCSRRLHRGLTRSGGISFPMHFNRSSFALP